MNFLLPFQINPTTVKIEHTDQIFSIGSCFADEMGSLLSDFKFSTLHNPFGVIYNPISINRLIQNSINQELTQESDVIKSGDIYYHWQTHGRISGLQADELEELYNHQIHRSHLYLKASKWLIITWGTALVYEYTGSSSIVANCHKIPGSQFKKRILKVEEILTDLVETIDLVRTINPDIEIILTISPVRHVKDGLAENNLSKAILIQAAHHLTTLIERLHYFPSYEIMIDVLRDYRFYKEDLIHPNDYAVKYIWNEFTKVYMSQSSLSFIIEWDQVMRALAHKPFHSQSREHQLFLKNTLDKLLKINQKTDVSAEIGLIKSQLI